MNRVVSAARLQAANPVVSLGVPWMVVSISFAINVAIWGLADLAADPDASANTGGIASLYITVVVVSAQLVAQVFPFALGLSLSRRTYYLGAALASLVQSLVFAVPLTVLTAVENATNGWGVGLDFWAPGALDVGNPALQLAVFALPMLAACFLGAGIGVVFKRWGATGMYALAMGTILLAGVVVVVVTWQQAWTDLWSWLTDRSVATMTLGLPAFLVIALAGLSYLGLRRAVP
ncbi:hypothetical protein [uncultured Modestobacter sp.]|uniref:hypothetical protein n=1 Tax=uncultured Modestobacter sp. TaxID=380048 RepID=UPI0026151F6F|nr:hypothetical protein [uncultured Modestobacter sp.]